MEHDQRKIVFYDGACMLCNRLIRFIMNKNIDDVYFSPLQSAFAQEYLRPFGVDASRKSSVYFTVRGKIFSKSAAVLKILASISPGYALLSRCMAVVPQSLRDFVYDVVARHRQRIFREKACLLPTPEQRRRILEQVPAS
jgi:predicted DCC family thiol-disulfide oxidoreductase YuxK